MDSRKALDQKLPITDLWDRLIKADIIETYDDVEGPEKDENGNDVYLLNTKDGYTVEIIVNDKGHVEIGDIGKGNLPPVIRRIETSSTKSSITAKAVVSRLKDGTIEYYYKLSTAEDSAYTKVENVTENGITVSTGITEGSTYTVKAVAKNENGEDTQTKDILAKDTIYVESITLNTTLEIILKEQTLSLTATITPENAENKTLKWTSSNEAVATVNENGVVTGRGEGEAIITVSATDGSNKQTTCSIIISPDPNIPNVKGFNLDRTYYVTYNENGENAKVGNKITANEEGIPNNIPTDWYNYGKRNWANIVVTDGTVENGTITGGTTSTYYTWIPRYQFMPDQEAERSKIAFVKDKEETTIDARLQIPEAFTFGETPLTGYWTMKYTANTVNNILQANTSTHYSKYDTMENWLPAFRNMEANRRSNGTSEKQLIVLLC